MSHFRHQFNNRHQYKGGDKIIFTLTLNPSLDYFLKFKNPIQNFQTTQEYEFFAGGKGINASKIFTELDVQNTAVLVSGGFTGKKIIDFLKADKISYYNVETDKETRINTKANYQNKTYEMNVSGLAVDAQKINQQLKKYFQKSLKPDDTVMIMGSLPKNYGVSDLMDLLNFLNQFSIKLVFDVSQNYLLEILKFAPEVIKPNKFELEQAFNVKITNLKQIINYGKKLLDAGAKRALISMGKDGSIYLDKNNAIICEPIKINEINGACAGDAMLAAFYSFIVTNKSLDTAFKIANAAGAATAAKEGVATKDEIEFYYSKANLKRYLDTKN